MGTRRPAHYIWPVDIERFHPFPNMYRTISIRTVVLTGSPQLSPGIRLASNLLAVFERRGLLTTWYNCCVVGNAQRVCKSTPSWVWLIVPPGCSVRIYRDMMQYAPTIWCRSANLKLTPKLRGKLSRAHAGRLRIEQLQWHHVPHKQSFKHRCAME